MKNISLTFLPFLILVILVPVSVQKSFRFQNVETILYRLKHSRLDKNFGIFYIALVMHGRFNSSKNRGGNQINPPYVKKNLKTAKNAISSQAPSLGSKFVDSLNISSDEKYYIVSSTIFFWYGRFISFRSLFFEGLTLSCITRATYNTPKFQSNRVGLRRCSIISTFQGLLLRRVVYIISSHIF